MASHLCTRAALMVFVSLASVAGADATPVILANAGFETPEATAGSTSNGLPNTVADWAGDASMITGADQGITPLGGSAMLRFLSSANPGAGWGVASDIWQLVDVGALRPAVQTGAVLSTFAISFNRVGGGSEPLFYITLRAFEGSPALFPLTAEAPLASASAFLWSDEDLATWERVQVSLWLPTNTTYLGVRIAAKETLDDTPVPFEFAGHYADDAELTVTAVPEPGTGFLAIVGLGALRTWRVRHGRR